MATFKDREGKQWTVEVTHGHVKPLRDECGLDLQDVLKEGEANPLAGLLVKMYGDPEQFGRLMWVICGRDAERANISPEDFAYRFNGQVMEDAATAVYEAVFEYFPPLRKAAKKAATAFREMMNQVTDAATKKVDAAISQAKSDLTSKLLAGNSAA